MPITDGSDIGFGTTIAFQTGLLAEIMDFTIDGVVRKPIEFIHMALVNGWAKVVASDIKRPGSLKVKIYFETQRLAAYKAAMVAAKETVTVTFPIPEGGTTAGTWAAPGFATNFSAAIPTEDGMTAECELAFTGEPTLVSAT